MSQRLLRVRELLRREISTVISRDFEFGGALVTINDVDLTPDLRKGHVFVSTLGAGGREEKIIEKLNENRGLIQQKLTKRVVLKNTPQLHFQHDDSVKRGVDVVDLIDGIEIPDQLEPLEEGDIEL